jgi:parallel beta-helix repeat protein
MTRHRKGARTFTIVIAAICIASSLLAGLWPIPMSGDAGAASNNVGGAVLEGSTCPIDPEINTSEPLRADSMGASRSSAEAAGQTPFSIQGHVPSTEEYSLLRDTVGGGGSAKNTSSIAPTTSGLSPPSEAFWEWFKENGRIFDGVQGGNSSLPAQVDLSTSPYFPAVGSQGGIGSCAAWATVYYCYGFMEATDNNWTLASQGEAAQLLNPLWTFNKVVGGGATGPTQVDGSWPWENLWVVTQLGVPTMATMPIQWLGTPDWGSEAAWREAPLHRGDEVFIIQWDNDTIDDLKALLNGGTPVAFDLPSSIYTAGFESNHIVSSQEALLSEADHCQAIVGYDDTIQEDGDLGAFRVVNSWGPTWADSGFAWITYQAMAKMKAQLNLTFITDLPDYRPELLATWHFDDAPSRDSNIQLSLGDPGASPNSTYFHTVNSLIIANDLPGFMCMDVTQFKDHLLSHGDPLFLTVGPSARSGTVSSFKLEVYDGSYVPGKMTRISAQSTDIPKVSPCNISLSVVVSTPVELLHALDLDLVSIGGPSTTTPATEPISSFLRAQGICDWIGTSSPSYDGEGAAQSGNVGDGGTSSLSIGLFIPSVSFRWKVSSEQGHDRLVLKIDGVERANISGEVDWTYYQVDLEDGHHLLQWSYQKDAQGSLGQDCGWLDQVDLGLSDPLMKRLLVDDDNELALLAAGQAWPGKGTGSDPFQVEDLRFDAQAGDCPLYIGNVTRHILFKDCEVTNSSGPIYFQSPGIAVVGSSNVTLMGCNVRGCGVGVTIWGSRDCRVSDCVLTSNLLGGLNIEGSRNCSIQGGRYSDNGNYGAFVQSSYNCSFEKFNCSSRGDYGIYIKDSADMSLEGLIASNNRYHGIFLQSVPRAMISNSTCQNNSVYGISLLSSPRSEVDGCTCSGNLDSGILLSESPGSEILDGAFDSNGNIGIEMFKSDNTTVHGAIASENSRSGLRIRASSDVTVEWCTFANNVDFGVFLMDGTGCLVVKNKMVGNFGAGSTYSVDHIQAYDYGTSNKWNDSQGGNFWSDWTGPDANHDGIVDSPYVLAGRPGAMDLRPIASLIADLDPPSVSILSPSQGSFIPSQQVEASWSGYDQGSGISHYEVRVDGGPWVQRGLSTILSIPALAEGEHQLEVRAFDMGGNQNSTQVTFIVDTIAPSMLSHEPVGPGIGLRPTIHVAFDEVIGSIAGNLSGMSLVAQKEGKEATLTFTGALSPSTIYQVSLVVADRAGNSALCRWNFSTTAAYLVSGEVKNGQQSVAGAEVFLDGVMAGSTDAQGHFSIQAPPGQHTLTIRAAGMHDLVHPFTTDSNVDMGSLQMRDEPTGLDLTGMLIPLIVIGSIVVVLAVLLLRRRHGS